MVLVIVMKILMEDIIERVEAQVIIERVEAHYLNNTNDIHITLDMPSWKQVLK